MFDKIGSWNDETVDAGKGEKIELPEIADFSDEIDKLSDIADFGDEDNELLNLSEIADLDNEAEEFPDLAEIADFGDEDEILDLPEIAELEDDDEFFDLPEVADLDDDDDEISDIVEVGNLEAVALVDEASEQEVVSEDVKEPIKNKQDGLRREKEVEEELEEKYPAEEGYQIVSEAYLRDKDGNIVKDEVTGEKRRVDFVVVKDGKVVDSVEVTSKTADKTEQIAKEERIRANGGNYVRDNDGNLVEIPPNVHTHIERRD